MADAPITNPAASAPSGAVAAANQGAQAAVAAPPPLIQAYDPTNQTPYSQPVLPGVDKAEPTAADELGPDPQIQNFGAATPAAGAAAVGAQLLRGVMRGVAVHKAAEAQQLHRTNEALQGNLQSASEDFYNTAKRGVDPSSDEYKAAEDRKQVAWQSLMDFYGKHIPGVKIDKATGAPVPGKTSIMDRLRGSDPAAVPAALYEGMHKAGAPVDHQIAQFQTPEYKAYIAGQGAQNAAGTAAATAASQERAARSTMQNQILAISQNPNSTPAEQAHAKDMQDTLLGFTSGLYKEVGPPYKDANTGEWMQRKINSRTGETTTFPLPGYTPPPLRTGGAPKTGWLVINGKPASVQLDANNQPNMATVNTQMIPPSWMLPQLRTGYITKIGDDNHMYRIPQTTSSSHVLPGGQSMPVYPGMPPGTIRSAETAPTPPPPTDASPTADGGAPAPAGAPGAAAPGAAPQPQQQPQAAAPAPAHATAAPPVPTDMSGATPAPHAASATPAIPGMPKGTVDLGLTKNPELTKANETLDSLNYISNVMTEGVKRLNPATSYSLAIQFGKVQNLGSTGAVRLNRDEITKINDLGGIAQRFVNAYERGTKGTLDPKIAQQMVDAVNVARQAQMDVINHIKNPNAAPAAAAAPAKVDYKAKYGVNFSPAGDD